MTTGEPCWVCTKNDAIDLLRGWCWSCWDKHRAKGLQALAALEAADRSEDARKREGIK